MDLVDMAIWIQQQTETNFVHQLIQIIQKCKISTDDSMRC